MKAFHIAMTMLMAAATNAFAQDAADTKFDLHCSSVSVQTQRSYPLNRIHIDLGQHKWCDNSWECDKPQPLIETADQLWLLKNYIDVSDPDREVMNSWIDRGSGKIHSTRQNGSRITSSSEGTCERRPYNSTPKNQF